MTDFTTPDLYDDYGDHLQVASAGLLHFGKITKFYGQAVTIQCPHDNSLVGEIVRTNGEGKVLVVDASNSQRFAFLGDNLAQHAIENHCPAALTPAKRIFGFQLKQCRQNALHHKKTPLK